MEDYILECTYIFSVLRAASFIYLYHLLSLGDKGEIVSSPLVSLFIREGGGKPLVIVVMFLSV